MTALAEFAAPPTTATGLLLVDDHDLVRLGLLTLVQVPYGFKFVWSPLMDRLRPPFLGSRRGWILLCQLVLAATVGALAWLATDVPTCVPTDATCTVPPVSPAMLSGIAALSLLIAFASASQDIVYDAYAVEVLSFGLAQGLTEDQKGFTLMGIGVWLAIVMFLNVWGVIWPNQKRALGIVAVDDEAKARAARTAMLASRINMLLSLPMLTSMAMYQTIFG